MKISKTSPLTVAEEMLGTATAARGNPGMVSPVAPGPNLYDGGAASKPQANTQPYNNAVMNEQNMMQNVLSQQPQSAAGAMGGVRKMAMEESGQMEKAQQFANQRKAEVIYANQAALSGDGGRSAISALGGMTDLDRAAFERNIGASKALASGLNPDLGDESGSARMYG